MVAWTMTGKESMLGIMARWLGRRRAQVGAFLAVAVRFVLVVAGLALLVAAAWGASRIAGLAAGGVACLVLEYVVKRR